MSPLEEEGPKAHDTQLATACQSLCIRGMDSLYLPFGINSFLIYNSKVHLVLSSSPRSNINSGRVVRVPFSAMNVAPRTVAGRSSVGAWAAQTSSQKKKKKVCICVCPLSLLLFILYLLLYTFTLFSSMRSGPFHTTDRHLHFQSSDLFLFCFTVLAYVV